MNLRFWKRKTASGPVRRTEPVQPEAEFPTGVGLPRVPYQSFRCAICGHAARGDVIQVRRAYLYSVKSVIL